MLSIISSNISNEAVNHIRKHRKDLLSKFCGKEDYLKVDNPFTIFMAGSPGAGKTEFSKSLIIQIKEREPETTIVRIDADEIRTFLPQFDGSNSDEVQAAAALGVEKIFDEVQDKQYNAILDGTFAKLEISKKNVERTLARGRKTGIYFLYQSPEIAWEFTKKRSILEGRTVPKDVFIEAFTESQKNVEYVKKHFDIDLNLVLLNPENKAEKTYFNIKSLDQYLKNKYTSDQLNSLLQ